MSEMCMLWRILFTNYCYCQNLKLLLPLFQSLLEIYNTELTRIPLLILCLIEKISLKCHDGPKEWAYCTTHFFRAFRFVNIMSYSQIKGMCILFLKRLSNLDILVLN